MLKMKSTTVISLVLLCLVSCVVPATQWGFGTKEWTDNTVVNPNNRCNCVCGVSNRQMRIVGGNVTKVNEFPWLASLAKGGEYYCGGTLLTRKHLLTAAHCINGFDLRQISVVLGDHDRNAPNRFSTTTIRGVRKVKSHKTFDIRSFNNDIAILELDQPVELNAKVQTACLPTSGLNDYTGRLGVVAGWGLTGEKSAVSPLLQKVAVPVWSKKDCYGSGYGEKKLTENMFCAGYKEGRKDACQGDSGGPLNLKTEKGDMEVIGIVSWGRGCGRPNLPGVYTKVTNYLDWITESLEGECLCPPPHYTPKRA